MNAPGVYLITDRHATKGRDLLKCVKEALCGGVRIVQLREKDLPARDLLMLAHALRRITKSHKARLLINDRVDVAKLSGADGVHLGVAGFSAKDARDILGGKAIIGVSAHTLAEAQKAQSSGADFITFGPIYETPSKIVYGKPVGLAALKKLSGRIRIPVYALGGIDISRVEDAVNAGASGVAMISAIFGADSVKRSAQFFVEKMAELRKNNKNNNARFKP